MRILIVMVLLIPLASQTFAASGNTVKTGSVLGDRNWIHGSESCATNSDPVVDVYAHGEGTYILRQNKCYTFEAPFIYVLVGDNRILLIDTGDIDSAEEFSILQTLQSALGPDAMAAKEILVIHSHSHGDHRRGDAQLEGAPNVTLVKPDSDDVRRFFHFSEWPQGQAKIVLGGRTLIVIPTPGHQEEAITVYDPQTKWLFTGDTLYPGYVYVKNWQAYKNSIQRLALFSQLNEVTAILGSHIEMKREPGTYYPIGTTFQPDEARLDLVPGTLRLLNSALQESDGKKELTFDSFIIKPMSVLQRSLSNLSRWITQ